jgi:hypothetical protein
MFFVSGFIGSAAAGAMPNPLHAPCQPAEAGKLLIWLGFLSEQRKPETDFRICAGKGVRKSERSETN